MVTVDYANSFFELDYPPNTTSDMIVGKLKHRFARHGSPEYLISDNGPQHTSSVMKKMVQQWGISHQTSSAGNSQSNGAAEAAIKTAKRLLRKCKAARRSISGLIECTKYSTTKHGSKPCSDTCWVKNKHPSINLE